MPEKNSINDPESQEEFELEDEDLQEYLEIALSNGFSKGTANVSPNDMRRLKGLLKHYAKKKHPFTSCVRDNTKRFGPERAKKVCAVLKDLIRGTTKWRSTERKKGLSDEEKAEFILSDYPEDDNYIEEFIDWATNLDEETVNIILTQDNEDNNVTDVELNVGDVAWTGEGSYNSVRRQIEAELNEPMDVGYGSSYWVEDIKKDEALVCHGGKDYYVIPFSVSKKGNVELDDEENWKFVERAWIESSGMNLSENDEFIAELFFTDAGGESDGDGLIWKTFLREGIWKYSPEKGKIVSKPLTIIKSGKSDPRKLIISMAELKKNFENGAVQHVTVPLNHDDKVEENTGFVKKLRFGKDEKGRTTLEAAIDFTEPDIKEKVERGTIPNVSGGIHFNHIDKEKGKKFNSVLGHIALTPKPWLQGMKPFGIKTSENLKVVGFSEIPENNPEESGGGEDTEMTTVETENTFLQDLGLSEDELRTRLEEYEVLKASERENSVDKKVREWEEAKKSPAMIKTAKAILMADDGESVLNLSEDGKSESLTVSEITSRLIAAAPSVNLSDDPITDRDTSGEQPNDTEEEELSDEIKDEANRLWLYENYSEEDALVEAKKRLSAKE